jgi:hypothetical protein
MHTSLFGLRGCRAAGCMQAVFHHCLVLCFPHPLSSITLHLAPFKALAGGAQSPKPGERRAESGERRAESGNVPKGSQLRVNRYGVLPFRHGIKSRRIHQSLCIGSPTGGSADTDGLAEARRDAWQSLSREYGFGGLTL